MDMLGDLLQRAGLSPQPDDEGLWLVEPELGVVARHRFETLSFEAHAGTIPTTRDHLIGLGRLSHHWGLGRVYQTRGFHCAAAACMPARDLQAVRPERVAALFEHLVGALETVGAGRVPDPLPSAPLPSGHLAELAQALGLRTRPATEGPEATLVDMDPGDGHRFRVRLAEEGPQARFDAWLTESTPPVDHVLANVLNAHSLATGSVALGDAGEARWAAALPGDWIRDDPELMREIFDHAAHATLRLDTLPARRQGIWLPLLLPSTVRPPDGSPLPGVCDDPRAPRVTTTPVDAETLEPVPGVPTRAGPLDQAVAALAEHLAPWRRQGSHLLVCQASFAAEQVLVAECLQEAHDLLGCPGIAVGLPRRGELVAGTDPAVVRAHLVASAADLSDEILWVDRGTIIGVAPR